MRSAAPVAVLSKMRQTGARRAMSTSEPGRHLCCIMDKEPSPQPLTEDQADGEGESLMAGDSMRRFVNRVALVTGGASGIGLATAQEFGHEAAAVVILDIDEARGAAARDSITAAGGQAAFVSTDVASPEACTRAVTVALERFGSVDYLVNSAVNFVARGLDVTPVDWDACLRVNVQGTANTVQASASALGRSGHGAVVNVAKASPATSPNLPAGPTTPAKGPSSP